MTAADYPSLDTLLTTATPADAEPFDVEALLMYRATKGQATNAGHQLAVYLNTLRVDTERARSLAVALEQECAAKDAAAHEALRWLDMAATYTTSEDAAAAIDDAAAALRAVTT